VKKVILSIACKFNGTNVMAVPMFQVNTANSTGAFHYKISVSIKEGKFLDRVSFSEIFRTNSAPYS